MTNAGVPPIVRAEGVTELIGDIVLNCTGGTPTPTGRYIPQSDIQVFLNTNITSRLLDTSSNLSEAILMIDEPFSGSLQNSGVVLPTPFPASAPRPTNAAAIQHRCPNLNGCTFVGVGQKGIDSLNSLGPIGPNGPYNGLTTPDAPAFGTISYNVYQGFQSGANSITWLGVPIDSPGVNAAGQPNTRVIRITNIRANACQLGVSSTLVPTQIVAFIAINGSQQVAINNPQLTVGFIQPGLSSNNRTANYLQCQNLNGSLLNVSPNGQVPNGPIFVTAVEGFASSFKVRNYAQLSSPPGSSQLDKLPAGDVDTVVNFQNVPGFAYNTESGFVADFRLGGSLDTGAGGLADTGTQIRFVFTGLAPGVSLFLPNTVGLFPAGSSVTATTEQTGTAILVGSSGAGSTQLSVSGATAQAVYEVIGANPYAVEQLVVPVSVAFAGNTAQNLPNPGQSAVAVNFAPLSDTPTASATAPIPRFCQPYPARNLFAINLCSCNLLFPFVTNRAGFDTGIAIANTTADPFGTLAQQGTVSLFYYGNAPQTQQSAVVRAGEELIFTLSGGGDHGIQAAPGFQGYIIATAQFQYCHGFAFISDIGAMQLAEGYLAIQMDQPGLARTGVTGEQEGH